MHPTVLSTQVSGDAPLSRRCTRHCSPCCEDRVACKHLPAAAAGLVQAPPWMATTWPFSRPLAGPFPFWQSAAAPPAAAAVAAEGPVAVQQGHDALSQLLLLAAEQAGGGGPVPLAAAQVQPAHIRSAHV